MIKSKATRRAKIKDRIRSKIQGTAEMPRLCVFRSNKAIYVQLIDDTKGATILSCSSSGIDKGTKSEIAFPTSRAISDLVPLSIPAEEPESIVAPLVSSIS